MRGYFLRCKEDDEDRLTLVEEDNEAARKIYRKDRVVLGLINYEGALTK